MEIGDAGEKKTKDQHMNVNISIKWKEKKILLLNKLNKFEFNKKYVIFWSAKVFFFFHLQPGKNI